MTRSALQRKESRRNNGRESQKAADRVRTAKAEIADEVEKRPCH